MSSVPPSTLTRFGVFELDLDRGELRRRGVRLAIQEQPLRVLAALLREPGEIISRNVLEAVLWGPEPAIDSERALNKAIHKLREVLGDDAEGARFVETVPRRGYRFVAPVGQARAGEISEQLECNPTRGELWLRKQPLLRASILPPAGAAIIPYHLALSPVGKIASASSGPRSFKNTPGSPPLRNAAARRAGYIGAGSVRRSCVRPSSNGPAKRSINRSGPAPTTTSNAPRAAPTKPLCGHWLSSGSGSFTAAGWPGLSLR